MSWINYAEPNLAYFEGSILLSPTASMRLVPGIQKSGSKPNWEGSYSQVDFEEYLSP